MLLLKGLRKTYGRVVALDDCSLEVPTGGMVGFLGPNGAGKTTAMRSIFGLVALDGGAVTWKGSGIDLAAMRRFGYMPEERGLYPKMTVSSQIRYFGQLRGMNRGDAEKAAGRLMAEFGLSERADDKVQDLSHGNQQRVQLAIALIHDPELLVLDEPFSGLDPVAAAAMANILEERASSGVAVLFSSHQLDVVEDLCRDVVIIHRGRVVLAGEVERLRGASPRRYLDAVVAGSRGRWAESVEDATIVLRRGDRVRLSLDGDADVPSLVARAARAGPILEFSFTPPDLSEVFAEVIRE